MGSRFSGLGSFWVSFEVFRLASWYPLGLQLSRFLDSWCLGVLLGASWDSSDVQLGDFVPSWEPCDATLGMSWMTLSPLGLGLVSFVYMVCEESFLSYLWRPLVEFVDIGEEGFRSALNYILNG